jgi:hypothetical protein
MVVQISNFWIDQGLRCIGRSALHLFVLLVIGAIQIHAAGKVKVSNLLIIAVIVVSSY